MLTFFCFFFQAEDGIRDGHVTGVQTCALPISLTPDTGYEIDGVTGSCGGTLSGNAFTTDPVTADCDVVAHFAEEPVPEWTVSPSVGSGQGSISPDTEQTVDEGDTITFTLTPDTGYEIDDVTVSCVGTLDGNEFATDPVTADCDRSAQRRVG